MADQRPPARVAFSFARSWQKIKVARLLSRSHFRIIEMQKNNQYEARLSQQYSELQDEELLKLAQDSMSLTENAWTLLQRELRSRRLVFELRAEDQSRQEIFPELAANNPQRGECQIWYSRPGDYLELAPDDCIFYFATDEEVGNASSALALHGIPSDSFIETFRKLDTRGPRLAVLPEDRQRAYAILSMPLDSEAEQQIALEKEDEGWQPLSCPACGAEDPLLTSVDPFNQWHCEICGDDWTEMPE